MSRFFAFASVVLLTAVLSVEGSRGTSSLGEKGAKGDKETKITGKLIADDPNDAQRKGTRQIHTLQMKAGNVYTIDMISTEFDSYLRLEDKDGKQLAEDDDSGGNLNARIVFACKKDGEFKVICSAFQDSGLGNYTLIIKSGVNNAKTTTAHEALIGKSAPDFQGALALNGKAGKMSDLKGKVVLLEFWDLRSADCLAAIERLRDWNKNLKAAGLETLSVTFYPSEIGQALGFDKDTGKLARVDKADKKSDEIALKQLAAHYKLEHRLMVLANDIALKAFDDYAVNGVPQAVLIDRKGIIRMVRVGDGKTAPDMEGEIKKLLADK